MTAAALLAAQSTRDSHSAAFVVLFRGVRIGTENISIARDADGWRIESNGRLLAPIDLQTTRFQLRYDATWQPRDLIVESSLRGQPSNLTTTFGPTSATSEVLRGTQKTTTTVPLSPGSIVLPANFFAAYEALAARLAGAEAGARIPVFVAPDASITVTLTRATPRRISRPDGTIDVRELALSFAMPSGPMSVTMWCDTDAHLARLLMPDLSIVAIREDLANVMAREEHVGNPGDESLFIPSSSGFNLGATITRPAGTPDVTSGLKSTAVNRRPAVVLVGGVGAQDREFSTYGLPIFGQLAGALSRSGYLVVRYDNRGVGQSGGRTESAGIPEYAADAIDTVSWLRKRNDVDADRIAMIAYADGGPIAMTAAGRDSHVKALALVAASGRNGRDTTIEQQTVMLAQMTLTAAERAERLSLQSRVIDATVTGSGWETVPVEVRRQADSVWFKSWLLFDPALAMKKIKQPILILHGALDLETPVDNAARLEQLAQGRGASSSTRRQLLPGVNHLLADARTGAREEYDTLDARAVSTSVSSALAAWLGEAMPSKAR